VAESKDNVRLGPCSLDKVAQPRGEPINNRQAESLLEDRFPGWLPARKCGTSCISTSDIHFIFGYMEITPSLYTLAA
jgi:hypothetical protein